jgi:translation initiation factor 5A
MSDDETFETGDAGASGTTPIQCGELRKGSHVMIKGNPCKIVDYSTSKTGKHGHAKAHIVAIDIFTGKKMEDLCPTSHNMSQPVVTNTEMQVLSADYEQGTVSLLTESGETKDDLNLPHVDSHGVSPETLAAYEKISKEICDAMELGEKTVLATVRGAHRSDRLEEKIVSFKLT